MNLYVLLSILNPLPCFPHVVRGLGLQLGSGRRSSTSGGGGRPKRGEGLRFPDVIARGAAREGAKEGATPTAGSAGEPGAGKPGIAGQGGILFLLLGRRGMGTACRKRELGYTSRRTSM